MVSELSLQVESPLPSGTMVTMLNVKSDELQLSGGQTGVWATASAPEPNQAIESNHRES